MIIKVKQNTLRLVLRILNNKESTEPVLILPPQKDCVLSQNHGSLLLRSTPEKEGVPRNTIENFFTEIDQDKTIAPHTVIVAKNDKIIGEKSYAPYTAKCWATSYSMCKTIAGMAIGFLSDEGKIDINQKYQKIMRPNFFTRNFYHRNITVKNLLTMTSGVAFNEAGSVTSTDWANDFMTSELKFKPGKEFMYNSMNSYMLAALVNKITGQGLVEYLTPRLFEPLGITDIFWEKCPQGIEKAGWGLYILPEDMAKLGLLVLNKGMWNGVQLLSKKWMEEATSTQIDVPEFVGKYNYGYQMWTGDEPKMAIFNGMFGQNIFILPKTGIVVVITAGNSDMFQSNNIFPLVEKYFGKFSEQKLLPPVKIISLKPVNQNMLNDILGRQIFLTTLTSEKIGLLPNFLQIIQNNYTMGLDKLTINCVDGKYFCEFIEGSAVYNVPFGFDKAIKSVIQINGESYEVASQGYFAQNDDDEDVLKIKIHFLEMASMREIKLTYFGNRVHLKFVETPGKDFLLKMLVLTPENIKKNILIKQLAKTIDLDYLLYKTKATLEPDLLGTFSPKDDKEIFYEFFPSKINTEKEDFH
ncbi:MAG TPA: serine hydrolase [Clostridia bacterium]|nr:serine hydrolase [Clostridia bacterium]